MLDALEIKRIREEDADVGPMELWKAELSEEDASYLSNSYRGYGYVLALIARSRLRQHSKVKKTQPDREIGRASEARGLLGRFHHHA